MPEEKEHFLDTKTLVAIGILVLSWFGWDYYMRKKYPTSPPDPSPIAQKQDKILEKKAFKSPKKYKETILKFNGEKIEILFSSKGFGIQQFKLKGYLDRKKAPVIFRSQENPLFSSLFPGTKEAIPFKIEKQGELFVGLFSSPQGTVKKSFRIHEDLFVLSGKIEIQAEDKTLTGSRLVFSHPLPEKANDNLLNMFFIYGQKTLKGFVSYEGKQKERVMEKHLEEKPSYSNLNVAGLGDKYFGKAFIAEGDFFPSVAFTKNQKQAVAWLDYNPSLGKEQKIEYRAFLGPKSLKNLQGLGGPVRQWIDFGFFSLLARPLLMFLTWLNSWSHNWGLAIILLTLFIRLGLLPINLKSYKSMKIMQKIQPQIKELREKHKSDPKKMNTEIMAMMKKHKANPFGGCLPLFLQFPVFFALYRVLGESIELYQSPFVLWIKDLSLKDPFYVLPILGGLILFVQQKITPMNLPKEQARLLSFLPLLFSVFMLSLPAGLTLYIFVSGLFGLAQQFCFVKLGASHFKGGENVKTVWWKKKNS